MYTPKLKLVQIFSSPCWFSFSSTVISCHQLLTADDSWYEKKLIGIFMYTLKLILVPNFSSLGWFSFSSTVISCHQLLTAVDSWWQLIWKKMYWNFFVHTKVDTSAKFQLSRLIFIFISCLSDFISCCQLWTADDSWYEKNSTVIFMYTLKCILMPNFSSLGWF